MTEINTLRRVDFPEAGEGCELLLRLPGFKQLYKDYGDNHFSHTIEALLRHDTDVMEKILAWAVTDKDGKPVSGVTLDSLDGKVTMSTLQTKLLDAFSLSAVGRTWEEHVKKMLDEAEQAAREAEDPAPKKNPTKGRAAGSGSSNDEPTLLDSVPASNPS